MTTMQEAIDTQTASRIVDEGVRRYIAARRGKVPQFVDRTFTFAQSMRLHRHALGLDLLRAPANVLMVLPAVLGDVSARCLSRIGARRAAEWLQIREWFLRTDVGREIEWRIFSELLELPIQQKGREALRDALAEEILSDASLSAHLQDLLAEHSDLLRRPHAREQLELAFSAYTGTRAAAAELANAIILTGAGGAALQKLTPGALSFGPAVAIAATQHAAIAGFPLGTTLGGLWYGVFPVQPALWLVTASAAGMLLLVSSVTAFTGVIADPVQRRLGVHQRRLHKFLDTLEVNLLGEQASFAPRDYYIARVIDIFEIARVVLRQIR
ncbi:MAG: hypothetical protein OET44_17745 [Gammaproteobacteria bacterium]|nr:hypothetical protein [Gammaproteobacteria bacterium]